MQQMVLGKHALHTERLHRVTGHSSLSDPACYCVFWEVKVTAQMLEQKENTANSGLLASALAHTERENQSRAQHSSLVA